MGVWNTRLYSGDFAMDLRSTVAAVSRLPFDGDRMAEILSEAEPGAANRPDDPDHATFWLVLADQFAKRGIPCERVRRISLDLIDSGSDLATLKKLGMDDTGLRQRAKMLAEVRQRVESPAVSTKPRPVLKKPQPLLMKLGDVFVYPTSGGRNINPYFADRARDKHWVNGASVPWRQDGWAAFVVIDLGRAFDFLAWYRPLVICRTVAEKPGLAALRGQPWRLSRPGTCSPVHAKRLELEKIGAVPVDPEKLRLVFPGIKPGISAAVSDICISNALNVVPGRPAERIPGIDRILAE